MVSHRFHIGNGLLSISYCWSGTDCSSPPYGSFAKSWFLKTLFLYFVKKLIFHVFFVAHHFGEFIGEPLTISHILKSG